MIALHSHKEAAPRNKCASRGGKAQRVSFFTKSLYSLVLFLVRLLIHPILIFAPSNFVPTWPLLDFFHLMSLKRCPICFRHLSAGNGFECSTTLLIFFTLLKLWFEDISHCWSSDILEIGSLSHEASPLSSNLIDMKESTMPKI